jgi:hypothetical protein
LASLLSGVAAALIVPLLLPTAGWFLALVITTALALWPILVGWIFTGAQTSHWSVFSGLFISAPLALGAHTFYHPALRILNLSDRTLTIAIDGKPVFTLPATSLESPRAGAELQLSLGKHQLVALDSQGSVVAQRVAQIVAGRTHLYAPLSAGSCFSIETTRYGRAGVEMSRHDLGGDTDFWVLSQSVDLWLTPAPESSAGSRWSGGTLTALRHHPCRASAR